MISGGTDPLIPKGIAGITIKVEIPELDKASATLANALREQRLDNEVISRNNARSDNRVYAEQERQRTLDRYNYNNDLLPIDPTPKQILRTSLLKQNPQHLIVYSLL